MTATAGLRDVLSKQVAFGLQGIADVVGGALDMVDVLADRVADLEARLAEYDDRGDAPPDASGAAGDSSQTTPAAPPPTSPPADTPLPGQTTIDDLPRPSNLARIVRALHELGGEGTKMRIGELSGVAAGSITSCIASGVRQGLIIDTGRSQPRAGRASPIYALPKPEPGSRADLRDRHDQARRQVEDTLINGPAAPTRPVISPARLRQPLVPVSPRVRRALERAARDAAGQPQDDGVRPVDADDHAALLRALLNGPRDQLQIAHALGISRHDATQLIVAAKRDGKIDVEDGVARLL